MMVRYKKNRFSVKLEMYTGDDADYTDTQVDRQTLEYLYYLMPPSSIVERRGMVWKKKTFRDENQI